MTKISIERFSSGMEKDWDDFVKHSLNGTIFHERKFLSYHIDRSFNDHSVFIREDGRVIAVLPAVEVDSTFYSHPGASYGWLVFKKVGFEKMNTIYKKIEEYCLNIKLKAIFCIPTPHIYYEKSDQILDYLFHLNNYLSNEVYISSIINLSNEVMDSVDKRKMRYINSLKRNSEISLYESTDIESFYPILKQNKSKHNVNPTHSIDELKRLQELYPDDIKLFLTYHKKQVVGGSVVFITNNHTSLLFYNVVLKDFRSMQIGSYQIYHAMDWSMNYGLKYLDLGVSQMYGTSQPLDPKDSLISFKEQFGAKALVRTAYKKSLFQ
tara:strand:+ start:478 stop:1446 length:969 start_codon:yes stop_codon:yes gene_type:complete